MPKVKSCGRASRTSSSGGAPKRASPRDSVRASSSATQGLPALLSRKRGAWAGAGEKHVVTSQDTLSTSTAVQPSQQEALLSPQLIETLVSRVAAEVSHRYLWRRTLKYYSYPTIRPSGSSSHWNRQPVFFFDSGHQPHSLYCGSREFGRCLSCCDGPGSILLRRTTTDTRSVFSICEPARQCPCQ